MKFPDNTFLAEWMQYCSESETPLLYDVWSGLWTLGTAIGPHVVLPREVAPVYLNWYVILVSESGVTRKSTAVRRARSMVNDIAELSLIESRSTPEGLERDLLMRSRDIGYSRTAVIVDELVRVLGRESYTAAMPGLLCDLYDVPERRNTTMARNRGELRKPFVSLLAATTPGQLVSSINNQVIEGGLPSRVMFVSSNRRKKSIPWPVSKRPIHTLKDKLDHTCENAETAGRVVITPTARAHFARWYNSRKYSAHPYLSSFESREDDHVLRCAACLAINQGTMQITKGHITRSINMIAEVKECGEMMFAGTGRPDDFVLAVQRIVATLQQAGERGVLRTALYRRVGNLIRGEELEHIISLMDDLQMASRFMLQRSRGRPAEVIRGTQHLSDATRNDTLIERLH